MPKIKLKTNIVLFLLSIEAAVAAIFTFLDKSDPTNAYVWELSLVSLGLFFILVISAITFFVLALLSAGNKQMDDRINKVIRNQWLQKSILLVMLFVSLFFIYKHFNWDVIQKLMPAGIFAWFMGLEIIFLFPTSAESPSNISTPHKKKVPDWVLALFSVTCIILSCLLPSGVPSLIRGLPWNSHIEFILMAALLPFAILLNWSVFSKKWVVFAALTALVFKISLALFAPAYGINIQAFRSPQAMQINQYEKSYEAIFDSQITTLMREPYNHLREFPIEWVNHDKSTLPQGSWIGLHLTSYGKLNQDERLVFLEYGELDSNINLTDINTGKKYPATLLDDSNPIDYKSLLNTPAPTNFILDGEINFQGDQIYHLRPILIKPDGSLSDPFMEGKLWRTLNGISINESQFAWFHYLSVAGDYIIILLVLACFLLGVGALYASGIISTLDLYLFFTILLVYPFSSFVPRPDIGSFIHWCIAFILVVKIAHTLFVGQTKWSSKSLIFIILPIIMLVFLSYDYDYLRQIEVFPKSEDCLDYQAYSSMIYLNGDFFLQNIPPRAYKILFPYLVGIIHMLFGQSASSLFFLYAWCAGLTCKKMLDIIQKLNLTAIYADIAAFLFTFVLTGPLYFLFYFRFGIIEPVAALCLIWVLDLALKQKNLSMFILGIITTLFRLDYLGAVFGAIFLSAGVLQGAFIKVWSSVLVYIKSKWKIMLIYGFSLVVTPGTMIIIYFTTQKNYMLNASDTEYHSVVEILLGLAKLASGGTWFEYAKWLIQYPIDSVFMAAVFYTGVGLAFIALFLRFGKLKSLDLRMALVILCYFLVYTIVKPTNYAPRFSAPLVPMSIISIMYYSSQIFHLGSYKVPETNLSE